VIVDFHTHIFPPHVRDNREDYARRDPTFAEMYADPRAKIATAEDLLASMNETGVDVSVTLGFAWRDHDVIKRHNDYLLESAAASSGRIAPFTTTNMAHDRALAEIERCADAGARGLGELRPDNQGWSLSGDAGRALAEAAHRRNLILLFHVTEPGDRDYPGRLGCSVGDFVGYARANPGVMVVGAHLGGDCFRTHECPANLYVDTAAQPFLYRGEEATPALSSPPAERLLFGTDFPLIAQDRQLDELRANLPGDRLPVATWANAGPLLGFPDA
jgi:predicted TIM-barrel fold metal-dependent hydrolase